MAMQQQQQLQMQQQRQRGPPGPLPGGLTPQALAQQQSQMMNDPEKRAKMAAFSAKLPGFKHVGAVLCCAVLCCVVLCCGVLYRILSCC